MVGVFHCSGGDVFRSFVLTYQVGLRLLTFIRFLSLLLLLLFVVQIIRRIICDTSSLFPASYEPDHHFDVPNKR